MTDQVNRPKFFQTEDFKSLNDQWKQKLKDSGFQDIERDEDDLQSPSTIYARNTEYGQSKAEYYRLAGQFLYDYRFSGKDAAWRKRIWGLHAEGHSIREIVKILDPEGRRSEHTLFKKVQLSLAKLSKVMIKRCQKHLND